MALRLACCAAATCKQCSKPLGAVSNEVLLASGATSHALPLVMQLTSEQMLLVLLSFLDTTSWRGAGP